MEGIFGIVQLQSKTLSCFDCIRDARPTIRTVPNAYSRLLKTHRTGSIEITGGPGGGRKFLKRGRRKVHGALGK